MTRSQSNSPQNLETSPVNATQPNTEQPELNDQTPDPDERDDFGLPRKKSNDRPRPQDDQSSESSDETFHDANLGHTLPDGDKEIPPNDMAQPEDATRQEQDRIPETPEHALTTKSSEGGREDDGAPGQNPTMERKTGDPGDPRHDTHDVSENKEVFSAADHTETGEEKETEPDAAGGEESTVAGADSTKRTSSKHVSVSEWSHQRLAPQVGEADEEEEKDEWQAMPAIADYDLYDDDGRLIAKGVEEENAEEAAYGGIGGAGKGYTRVQLDEDAMSATSMDDDTRYLFKESQRHNLVEEDDQRDAVAQLQATKDLLTEGQRIAYVGVTRLAMHNMAIEIENARTTKHTKKDYAKLLESMKKWVQLMMIRIYAHMEIDTAEQLMIEQLAEHGVQPADLAPPLMKHAKVKNPMAEEGVRSPTSSISSPRINSDNMGSTPRQSISEKSETSAPTDQEDVPDVHTPSQMTHDAKIDLDLRWTVLCDLFLVLISDSTYDARSRVLLERVAAVLDISWVQICRFEKRVIDALEMQEEKDKENWNEEEHLESRRKKGLKHKYMVMGLATVGGGLVIGLSAGLLAPVIGAGLAAGFTTIGVTGTAGFLGGIGGAALITSASTAAGGIIAIKASNRRTGHVRTFEYRPLHNNKRLNLIVTVSGWMSGKVDDVRLPYSTVDPIMGDIYSLLWEPEMLQSMGDTINILATEALTQAVQQVLGATLLVALMSALQLPIVLSKLAYLIDNPWTVSLGRANAAGLILADSLIDRHLGNRPITLVGFSLGSRLIFSCLKELAHRGAYGIVQNVYLFGSPVVNKRDEYLKARSAVSGRFVNGYASNDWILGYLFRATSGGVMSIAGLAPVEGIPGLENFDVTSLVAGHMAYRAAMPRLLREVGWEVESDEFTEIEDPDPEDHARRQRELIKEIDEARKEAEAKPEKKRFGLFSKGKLAKKKGWETYEHEDVAESGEDSPTSNTEPNVLFDVEAIKRELESEMIEVKQLESTLPPMKLDFNPDLVASKAPHDMLRQTKSSGAALGSLDPPPLPSSDSLPIRTSAAGAESRPGLADSHHEASRGNSATNGTDRDALSVNPEFEIPRELKSTLPPLTIKSPGPNESTSSIGSVRPELKSHNTMPVNSTIGSNIRPLNIEHNAWADEEEDFGEEGEIKMTFE